MRGRVWCFVVLLACSAPAREEGAVGSDFGGLTFGRTKAGVVNKPLTGAAAALLTPLTHHSYSNSGHTLRMESVPSDGIFPTGQLPLFSAINARTSDMQEMAEKGFTAVGFYYGSPVDALAKSVVAVRHGLKVHVMVGNIRPLSSGSVGFSPYRLCMYYYNDPKAPYHGNRSTMLASMKACMDEYLNHPRIGSRNICAWETRTDDHRMNWKGSRAGSASTIGTTDRKCHPASDRSYNRTDMMAAENWQWEEITKYDPAPHARPVTTLGLAGMYSTSKYHNHVPKSTLLAEQTYFGGGSVTGNGDKGGQTRYAKFGSDTERAIYASSKYPNTLNGLPRAIVPTISMMQNSFVDARSAAISGEGFNTKDAIKRQTAHDILLILLKGGTGAEIYKFERLYDVTSTVYQGYREGYFHILNALKTHDVGRALIWGKRDDTKITVSAMQTLSQRTRTFYKVSRDDLTGRTTYAIRADMLTYACIRYKGVRFVVISNSMPHKDAIDFYDIGGTQKLVYTGDDAGKPAADSVPLYSMIRLTDDNNTIYVATTASTRPGKAPYWYKLGSGGISSARGKPHNHGIMNVTIHGLPTDGSERQIKVTELIGKKGAWGERTITPVNGQIHLTLDPLQSVICKIEPAAGYIGR